jgi:hypothetical protein
LDICKEITFMRTLLSSRLSYIVAFVLFALALALNGLAGGSWPAVVPGTLNFTDNADLQAHGPTMPPSPWEDETNVLQAHGPTMPPSPWEDETNVLRAHGPTMPPSPWEDETNVLRAHGPTMPPSPWEDETNLTGTLA